MIFYPGYFLGGLLCYWAQDNLKPEKQKISILRFFVFQVFKSPGLSSRANPLKSSLRARSRDLEQLFKKTFWNPSTERKVTAWANLLCGRGGGTYNSHRIDLRNPIELHEPAHVT